MPIDRIRATMAQKQQSGPKGNPGAVLLFGLLIFGAGLMAAVKLPDFRLWGLGAAGLAALVTVVTVIAARRGKPKRQTTRRMLKPKGHTLDGGIELREQEVELIAGLFTESDLEVRLPVWMALSELFLDTTFKLGELKFIAQRLAQSPFPLEEVEGIFLYEVAPVLHQNLRGKKAGEQKRFVPEKVRNAVLRNLEKNGYKNIPSDAQAQMIELVEEDWEEVKNFVREYHRMGV